ncbi:MAG: hypothetical protein ACR2JG_00080, partial [Geodermatophilaceae bacterium]
EGCNPRVVFEHIYDDDVWVGGGSGHGSDPRAALPWVDLVAETLRTFSVTSVVDAGCGDWRMWPTDAFAHVDYLGVDVVPSVIADNRAAHGAPGRSFEVADLLTVDLPCADLLITKDVWQHWENEQVLHFLQNNAGKYRVILAANDIRLNTLRSRAHIMLQGRGQNSRGKLGDWRPLDLRKRPFAQLGFERMLEFRAGNFVKAAFMLQRRGGEPPKDDQ